MESLKKKRSPIRAMITRTIKEAEIDSLVDNISIVTLKGYIEKLNGLLEKMESLDQSILDKILENEEFFGDYENEYASIQEYIDNISITKLKINEMIEERVIPKASTQSESEIPDRKRQFKLPKIELKKFSGKLLDWLSWWAQFKKIHHDDGLHATDKFQYLIQSMEKGSRAEEIVEGFPATEENYPKVITALKERFGKKKLLTQVYIRELFQMGLTNLNNKLDVTSTYDKLVCHIRALESLKITVEQSSLFLYPMVESSLPDEVMVAWQRSSLYEKDGSIEDPPKSELDFLLQFLKQEVEREEQRTLVKAGFITTSTKAVTTNNIHRDSSKGKGSNVPTAAVLFNGQTKSPVCIFCDKPHDSKDCGKTEFWSLEDIQKVIHEKQVCTFCLKTGHISKKCRSFVKCLLCPKRHYTFMCPEIKNKKANTKNETSNSSARSNFDCNGDVLLKTIKVYVINKPNQKILARILFDDGSQKSYITSSTVKAIKSVPLGYEYVRNILFDGSRTDSQKLNTHLINIRSLYGVENISLMLRERSVLGGKVSRVPKGVWLDELRRNHIWINDVEKDGDSKTADIDIVIGSDYWGTIMKGNKVTLGCGLTAYESIFGWTLSGVVPEHNQVNGIISMFLAEENLQKLWNLEVIGIRDPIEKATEAQEEAIVKKIFLETVKRDKEGRYKVKLPWNVEIPDLPNNKNVALQRLMSATKKLNSNNQFQKYDDIFNSWIEEGFVEKIKENEINGYYLPHHPIFKESITTPVRPVFDASFKCGRYPSLNDCLYKGPNLIELLPTVLIRFRLKSVGVVSDIRKAFQMIDVEENDQEYLRFLWWEDSTQSKIIVLKHKRVVFGLKCSPYLLAAVLENHLKNVNDSRKKIADELLKSLYVDNCVTSLDSYDEYEEFKKVSMEILAEAKMDLRQWEHSSPQSKDCELETKVLGMVWNKCKDTLRTNVPSLKKPEILTKRTVASVLHQFFDPIGYIGPTLLQPKIMLQQAWKENVSWDCELPISWTIRFSKWCEEAHLLKEIEIPRLCQITNSSNRQLHTFTDASQNAYATAVYLRTEHEKNVNVQLILSKSRVAPIGKPTIPRLELLGCLIGSRLATSSKEAMNLKDIPLFFWCDSTTAIAWIQRNNEWGTFVGNRVKRILQVTEACQWRHIPGELNPADLPSRGCSPKELVDSKWWEGPEWLKLSVDKWPNNIMEFNEDEISSEKKKKSTNNMFSADMENWFKTKYASYTKNVRVMAWIRRFCNNARKISISKEEKNHLSIKEIRDAEVDIIRIIQSEGKMNPKEDKRLKQKLSATTINDNGIIRLKTPITRRMDTIGFRFPYLLPRTHILVRNLIRDVHLQYCHAGSGFLMAKLREKYWITQSRKTISSVVQECIICKRHSAKRMEAVPTSLPETRVTSGEIYDNTGVDLFGYLTLKDKTKVWVVLYTCAVYRAVHLDVINSLSMTTFIESLTRFIFMYGRPKTMISDNATNFRGTARLLKTIGEEELKKECVVNKIQWNFNPPAAPWWGGFFERLVRSVKEPMRRILGNSVVDLSQLQEILMEIERVMNDRPLTTVTEDPTDLEPLTPAMFLRGTKNATFPEGEEISKVTLQKEWRRIADFKRRITGRFRREYLGQLLEHSKVEKSSEIRVGDIVLVGTDNRKRINWPMGRVEEIMPGSDTTRVVRVRTKLGCINRALQRLYPLEMSKPESKPIGPVNLNKQKEKREETKLQYKSIIPAKLEKPKKNQDSNLKISTRSGRKINKPVRLGIK